MKANRKFVQADEAVSPVIAVILMVAITVVLAATVFVLVSDIGGNTGSNTPAVSWAPDEAQDRLAITTAAQNADWFRLQIQVDQGTGCTGSIYAGSTQTTYVVIKEAALDTGAAVSTATCAPHATPKQVGNAADRIEATDYIEFCHDAVAATDVATNVKITVKDTTANAVAFSYTFTNIANC